MRKYKRRILAALCCFLAAACSLSAIPFFRGQSEQMPPGGYAVAAVFWGSLLLGLGLSLAAALGFGKYRRRAENRGLIKRSRVPGVFRFRREHWLLYLILAAGIVCGVTDYFLRWIPGNLLFPILSVTALAFALHCVLDGNHYQAYVKMKEGKKNGSQT